MHFIFSENAVAIDAFFFGGLYQTTSESPNMNGMDLFRNLVNLNVLFFSLSKLRPELFLFGLAPPYYPCLNWLNLFFLCVCQKECVRRRAPTRMQRMAKVKTTCVRRLLTQLPCLSGKISGYYRNSIWILELACTDLEMAKTSDTTAMYQATMRPLKLKECLADSSVINMHAFYVYASRTVYLKTQWEFRNKYGLFQT